MKKYISILFAMILTFSLCACGVSTDSSDIREPLNTSDTSTTNAYSSETEDTSTSSPAASSIEETVLVDEKGIKITAKELSADSLFGPELKLLIENNSEKNLTIQARNTSLNGYMIESMMSVDVAAGKKANDSITFMSSDLETCGIDAIADMGFAFHVFTTEDWETYLDTPQLQLKTSIADSYEYVYDNTGLPVYEGNGVKIVAKGLSENDSIFGPGLILYLHNTNDQAVTVQVREVSVNGFMVDSLFSEDMMPGKHAVSAVTFLSSDLEDNGITNITNIELSFHIFETDSWDSIADTDTITLNF